LSVGIFFLKRKFSSKMVFRSHILPSKISFLGMWVPSNFLFWKFFFTMIFRLHMPAIKISFFGMWVPSEIPKKEILMAYVINNFLKRQLCFPRERKNFIILIHLHNPSKFPFWEFPKKAIFHPQSKENFIIFDRLT